MRSKQALLVVLLLSLTTYAFAQQNNERKPQKSAVLIGVNSYPEGIPQLKGTLNDVARMNSILKQKFVFSEVESITEANATCAKIIERLDYYKNTCEPGDVFLFYFSGYGSYVPDKDGDEADGLDEILCPYDFNSHWDDPLSDDVFVKEIAGFKKGVYVIVILDCCFTRGEEGVFVKDKGRPKTILPIPAKLRDQVIEKLKANPDEKQAVRFIDGLLPPDDVAIAASRGYRPTYDVNLKGREHGVFTCCMSANAERGMTYRALISSTHISCLQLNYLQFPVLKCCENFLNSRIFEALK